MEINGTTYNDATPTAVVKILEAARTAVTRVRLRFWYGDQTTGKAWDDRPKSGYIGRSTGQVKIPLCVHNSRSLGGPGLLEHYIVKIEAASKVNRVKYPGLTWQRAPKRAFGESFNANNEN